VSAPPSIALLPLPLPPPARLYPDHIHPRTPAAPAAYSGAHWARALWRCPCLCPICPCLVFMRSKSSNPFALGHPIPRFGPGCIFICVPWSVWDRSLLQCPEVPTTQSARRIIHRIFLCVSSGLRPYFPAGAADSARLNSNSQSASQALLCADSFRTALPYIYVVVFACNCFRPRSSAHGSRWSGGRALSPFPSLWHFFPPRSPS
jgi:hypothetical protein